MIAEIFRFVVKLREQICGAAVGEFRAGEAVALWSVSGAERAAEGAASGSWHPRACRWDV